MGIEKTGKCPLAYKEIKPVNPKGNQPWILIGRSVGETPKLWPFDVKGRLTGKDPDAGKDGKQKKRGQQMMWWLHSITDSIDMNLNKLKVKMEDRGTWHAIIHRLVKSQVQLSDWATTAYKKVQGNILSTNLKLKYSTHKKYANNYCTYTCCCAWSLSHIWLFAAPWTVVHKAPQSIGILQAKILSGLLCPPPGDLPNPGLEPRSPTSQVDPLPSEPPGKPSYIWIRTKLKHPVNLQT